ncbi:hypothetical protein LMG19282_04685 [Cupriavidus campinensis]|uniref:hypothetical protein n=1 Tax=Cupriavidus campinensis TaxID=151783 RepID=UPI001B08DD37|nr:hypothetical protein [Cupriavidus campinensis]CAG2154596.1 hypothetical protein LMG19282_04685 [Cupriavidus campinensis]
MGRRYLAGLLLAVTALAGCAVVQKPIPATSALFENKEKTVAVALEKLPEPNQVMLGAQGILDYAINRANAKAIVDRLQKQDFSKVSGLPKEFVQGLESRQIKVVMIEEPIDTESLGKFTEGSGDGVALRDYRPLARKYKADKLLLVSAASLGTVRSYYGFLPLTPPTAYISLTGQLVDLSTNKLEWYEKVENRNAAKGDWDQAPEYENLMGAVDEGTRAATSQLRGAFFVDQPAPAAPKVTGTAAAGSAQ